MQVAIGTVESAELERFVAQCAAAVRDQAGPSPDVGRPSPRGRRRAGGAHRRGARHGRADGHRTGPAGALCPAAGLPAAGAACPR